jgi:hypothetical protein
MKINFYMAKMREKRHISILDMTFSLIQSLELVILYMKWNLKEE